jgi:hypothetical protein
MFTVDPTITDLKVKEKSMLKVLFSMNTHQVATPEMNLEEVRSYVIFCHEGDGKVSAYIALHLLDTNRRLFYPYSSNPFPKENMDAVDEEARGFAEGLGAMLDEIDITKMTSEEKNHWIDDQLSSISQSRLRPNRRSKLQRRHRIIGTAHAAPRGCCPAPEADARLHP